MKAFRTFRFTTSLILLALLAAGSFVGFRALRLYYIGRDWERQLRYLVGSGESIDGTPASEALSENYLDSVLGDNPELLSNLKSLIQTGMEDDPSLNLGEVTALNVTYNRSESGQVENVVAHVCGGLQTGQSKAQMHQGGYFKNLLDEDLYDQGNKGVAFLGRDMVFFTTSNNVSSHQSLLSSLYSGDIIPLAQQLTNRVHTATVFPKPDKLLPPQLRRHTQSVILKGSMGQYDGSWDIILITKSERSASYVLSVVNDMKRSAEALLATAYKGEDIATEWGGKEYVWWAKAMLRTARQSRIEQVGNIIRVKTKFDRKMVNASLKVMESAMRDYRMIRASVDSSDSRIAGAVGQADALAGKAGRLQREGKQLMKYWGDEHEWGPDWPIPPQQSELGLTADLNDGVVPSDVPVDDAATPAPEEEPTAQPANP
ncbi:MAG: hypothetical protein EOL87_02470 [Spartobacteria bacterium]|nr:hypothetical protein [Spartobacteria bacterium]